MALHNYPSIAAVQSKSKATAAKIELAKTEYLPRMDLFVQELRGSTNNVLGILFPPLSIPQVAGRQEKPINFDSVWASNASAFFSWELVDFGLRHSRVKEARVDNDRTNKLLDVTKFAVACEAAEAFFGLVGAQQKVRAQRANVERMRVFAMTVNTLVNSDLRPGVDASRADAELAMAQDRLILAEQEQEIARAIFAERMGLAEPNVDADPGPLLVIPENSAPMVLQPFEYHPVAVHQSAVIKAVQARLGVLQKEWRPRIYLESGIFSRGSGAQLKPSIAKLGYLPNIPNWAVGFKAEFHVFDIFAIKAREKGQRSLENEERSRYQEVMLRLRSRDSQAKALIDGASRLAKNAPLFLRAAVDTETRSRTRYGVGLNTVVDVAEAERLLTDAQVTYDLAGLGVWRSYLAAAEAHGDLAPFLQMVNAASGDRK